MKLTRMKRYKSPLALKDFAKNLSKLTPSTDASRQNKTKQLPHHLRSTIRQGDRPIQIDLLYLEDVISDL